MLDIAPRETALERIFNKADPSGGDKARIFDLSDPEEYESYVLAMIEDTQSYEESELGPQREEADKYYKGQEPALDGSDDPRAGEDALTDRSSIVVTTVRDVILSIMPSLVRIFTAREHPVEFMPNTEQDVPLAEQATDYISHVFWEDNPGFLIIHNVLKDCLNKGIGIVKWHTDPGLKVIEREYTGIDPEQYQYLVAQPGAEVVDEEMYMDEAQQPKCDCTIRITRRNPIQRVIAVPPDEFRINRNAKCLRTARVRGHVRNEPVSYLVELGYDHEEVSEWTAAGNLYSNTTERALRNPGLDQESDVEDMVEYGEYWINVDKDGDGIAELRYICIADNKIIQDIPATHVRMALFCPDPEPHTAIGHSINELVRDLQKIETNVLRNVLDSLAQSVHPRMEVVENMVNMDDVYSDDVGDPIRVKAPGMITPIITPFAGEPALAVLAYMDNVAIRRTGQSDASKGLDPKALQSTTMKGVDMVITGAQERTELIARILAETGFKDMFKGLLIETTEHPNQGRTVKLRGKWVPVYPDAFDPDMNVKVNPAIGRGSDMDRFMMLNQIAVKQEAIVTQLGPQNPICKPENWLNTIQDMMNLAGMKNFSRYFNYPSPEEMQQMAEQMGQPSAEDKLAEAEAEKVRAMTVGKIADNAMAKDKQQSDDDFRRDQLEAKTQVDMAKVGVDAFKAGIDATSLDVDAASILAGLENNRITQQAGIDKAGIAGEAGLLKAGMANEAGLMKADMANQAGLQKADMANQAGLAKTQMANEAGLEKQKLANKVKGLISAP